MSEFFKGWRRKMGVMTLVMACVFAVLWARSQIICDMVSIHLHDVEYDLQSHFGLLVFTPSENSESTDPLFGTVLDVCWSGVPNDLQK